jgi:hypothetical protein
MIKQEPTFENEVDDRIFEDGPSPPPKQRHVSIILGLEFNPNWEWHFHQIDKLRAAGFRVEPPPGLPFYDVGYPQAPPSVDVLLAVLLNAQTHAYIDKVDVLKRGLVWDKVGNTSLKMLVDGEWIEINLYGPAAPVTQKRWVLIVCNKVPT